MMGRSAAEAANASAKVSRRGWNEKQLKEAPLPDLGRAKGNLKAFNARRKLRAAAMVARLRSMVDGAEEQKVVAAPKKQNKEEKGCMIQ